MMYDVYSCLSELRPIHIGSGFCVYMPKLLDKDFVARVLVESMYMPSTRQSEVAKRHGIALRTLCQWRQRLSVDTELQRLVTEYRGRADESWSSELSVAIRAGIHFLREAAEHADRSDPAAISAVAEAVRMLTEIGIMREVMDARLAQIRGGDGATDRLLVAGSSFQGDNDH